MSKGRRRQLIRDGLLLLLDAYDYAVDCEAPVWDFAVDVAQLQKVGLTENEFRWLIRKGYAEHRVDTTLPGDAQRTFRPILSLRFLHKSCFMLTPAGVDRARSLARDTDGDRAADPETDFAEDEHDASAQSCRQEVRPFWDGERHELWLGDCLIKQFKRYAQNQETILAAFQEEGWPAHIDDPLAPEGEIDSKRRLNDTIKSLNRHQNSRLVRFTGDGRSEGVIWERVDENGHPVWQRPPQTR